LAEQAAAVQAEKEARTPAERKVDANLLFAVRERAGERAVAGAPALRSLLPATSGPLLVDIDARVDDRLLDAVAALGGEVVSAHPRFGAVRAEVPPSAVLAIAARGEVAGIRPADEATTNRAAGGAMAASVGMGANEADLTHLAAQARATYGVDGTGVKACVLSDGVDSLAGRQATDDLPEVEVLPGQAGGGDEGTAMLELIHDLAPGAELAFATAFSGIAQFAQNIDDLVASGCDLMVDDVTYFSEPTFQDGPIAQAITRARSLGVTYFSSAGNSGNLPDATSGTWQGDFQDAGPAAAPLPAGGRLHGWGVGAAANPITLTGGPVNLQWADPLGASANDYDLYLLNAAGTAIVASSTNIQTGSQDPAESIATSPAGSRVVVVKAAAASPRFLVVYTNRGRLTHATGGSARGHNVSPDAISVGATPAGEPLTPTSPAGPFPEAHRSTDVSQLFSSDGPARQFFTPAGLPLTPGDLSATGGVTSSGPDVTAADGVTTTTPGFGRFFGTSASAPNALALAALALEAVPGLSPDQLEAAIAAAAIDIEAPGVDPVTGAGIVMGPALLDAVGASPKARLVAGPRSIDTPGGHPGAVAPGEVAAVLQQLTNEGSITATGITATLSSPSPHVTVLQDQVAYPDAPAGATVAPVGEPLAFELAPDCPCGVAVPLVLTVAFQGGVRPSVAIPFTVVAGRPQPPTTATYAGPPLAIPDASPAGAAATLPVAVPGRTSGLTVTLGGSACTTAVGASTVGIDHSYVGDLTITLTSPAGTTVTLVDRSGGAGNNLCQTTFSDAALRPISSISPAEAPFTGTFRPVQPLAAFAGEDPTGTWTLRAVDGAPSDTGSIRSFSLGLQVARCDDGPTPTEAYVDAVYQDFLGRSADAGGLAFWRGRLDRGVETRASFVRQMARSNEYAVKIVTRSYADVLGRAPDPSGRSFWANRVRHGMAPSVLVLNLIASNEFLNRSGGSVGGFVDATYQAIFGRLPDPSGRAFYVRAIEAGRPRLQVAGELYASSESRRRRTRTQYDLLLRRPAPGRGARGVGHLARHPHRHRSGGAARLGPGVLRGGAGAALTGHPLEQRPVAGQVRTSRPSTLPPSSHPRRRTAASVGRVGRRSGRPRRHPWGRPGERGCGSTPPTVPPRTRVDRAAVALGRHVQGDRAGDRGPEGAGQVAGAARLVGEVDLGLAVGAPPPAARAGGRRRGGARRPPARRRALGSASAAVCSAWSSWVISSS
jgi:subtilisin-like proprotein convertase family protein